MKLCGSLFRSKGADFLLGSGNTARRGVPRTAAQRARPVRPLPVSSSGYGISAAPQLQLALLQYHRPLPPGKKFLLNP